MNRQLTEHIELLPPISQSLPLVFKDGAKLDYISVKCAGCGAEIQASNIRGTFTLVGLSVTLSAYALCYADHIITPIEVRFSSSGEMLIKGSDGWIQSKWCQQKPFGWFTKLKGFFQGV